VAAHLLLRQGHEVIGVFMRHGEATASACSLPQPAALAAERPPQITLPIVKSRSESKQGCCSASDAEDARKVADSLSIPFYAIDFQREFGQIIDYFIDEYTAARTPNPCVMCNNWIKFGRLFDYADSVGAEFVATGHYARLEPARHANGEAAAIPALCRGVDEGKDQSYVLFGIDAGLLPRMLLPVGDYFKPQIREIAREMNLRVADKKDSQEICFVPNGDHAAFIRGKRGESATAGEIVTSEGLVVGHHDGLERFTIGQRKGLGVALLEPRYVVRLEHDTHRVVLGSRDELGRRELTAGRSNWLVPGFDSDERQAPRRCSAKIRYNSPPATATVEPLPDRRLRVVFDEPQFAVAPGQAVVCYDGDRVLGGGWIES
jgi:tRNA-uridine 2-sulfurtransferase